jgi:predicted CoA-binding protein
LAVKVKLLEIKEQESMVALFPTFGKIAKKIKQVLSTDVDSLWQQILLATEVDESEPIVYAIGDSVYW